MRLLATIVSIGLILFTGALFAWSAEGTSVNTSALDLNACEDFESGYPAGSIIGDHPDWFTNSDGPAITAGIGVAGSIGLPKNSRIFTWTAHPFDWNAPDFLGMNVQMDFQTDGSGNFDDDRIGWMIDDESYSSSDIMGVQLDPGGSGYCIEGYWDGVSAADKRPHIVDLPALGANTWYRFRVEFTKLTATSARIDASLTELDGSGNPLAEVASGSILDTAALGDDEPNSKYFDGEPGTGNNWPGFKNHSGKDGAADNPCVDILTGAPVQYTLTVNVVGDGTVDLLPAGGLYDGGTVVDLEALANPGSNFWAWSGDLSGNANPTSITMDGDRNVTATFIPESTLSAGDVIISSFQATNPVGGQTNSEFIELFNTTDQPIALDYLQLVSRTDNNADGVVDVDWALDEDMTGKVIAPNSFFLIAESDVPAPGGVHDVETDMDLATGEGGVDDRAICYDLSIGLQHMDYVLYGNHDGSDPAGEIPPGDIAFDGVSYPRTEVIRNTVGGGSFAEGLVRRDTPPDLFAGYDVEGFYTDEAALGDGFPAGVWTSPHDNTDDTYEARNSLTTPVTLTMYDLTVTVVGDGDVTLDPAGGIYYSGTPVELAATADPGWIFSGWSGDLSGFTNPADVTMTADLNITATFVEVLPLETGHVIISAFQSWNTVGSQNPGEFIELFNTTSLPISLEGMELISRCDNNSDGVLEIDWALSADLTGKVIGPFGFFLVAESGVAAPDGLHDVATDMDLATGEGGSAERAISIELAIDGLHMDYVLYGRHDGSDPAGELPPGDIPFDGTVWPRAEVIRNTLGTDSFQEGLAQRVLTEVSGANYDVEGYYTDENVLGDGFPDGVWFCPHSTSYDNYEARNSLSPPLDPAVPAASGHIMARMDGSSVSVDFRVNFTDLNPLRVVRRVGGSSETRTWGPGDFSSRQESSHGYYVTLRDLDRVGFPREYTLVYQDAGGELTLDQAKVELPPAGLELKLSAFPNPFNPRVEIKFTIPQPASTRLEIFDSRGRLVQTLVSGAKPAGEGSVFWTGEDSRGRAVASGVYHLRLVVGHQQIMKTVTLVR